MTKIILLATIIIVSCNTIEVTPVTTNKPTSDSTIITINNTIKTDSTSKALIKLITNFCKRDFRESRKQLVAEGAEHDYQISEIIPLGNSLKYDVVIPGIEGKMEYTCTPQNGELIIVMVGDNDIAQMYYKQNKISKKWDHCNENDGDEQCQTYEDWKTEPLQSHFTISLVHQANTSIYTFRRVIMPK